MTDTTILVNVPTIQTVEENLGRVRWNKKTGKLEQTITLIDSDTKTGRLVAYRNEWREVPTVDPD